MALLIITTILWAFSFSFYGEYLAGHVDSYFALLFGAGLQMLLPRGRRWIQSRLTLLVLLGFIHGLLFWDGDILLAYGLVGLICWRLVRDAPSVKSLFNTGVMLYLVGLGVLLLLGLISDSQTSRAWTPDASAILYEKYWKLHGGVDAISNRADGVGNSLLALGAQYGWQLAGMRTRRVLIIIWKAGETIHQAWSVGRPMWTKRMWKRYVPFFGEGPYGAVLTIGCAV